MRAWIQYSIEQRAIKAMTGELGFQYQIELHGTTTIGIVDARALLVGEGAGGLAGAEPSAGEGAQDRLSSFSPL
ncbi:hypothetical protein J6590_063591 [Homalodisca vitripennis]|nr:hypothetical protein J6590_063591 [Homalodisca vitripennis]